jgi:UDP-N-acetyl-D-glucosamine dehydrogenase
MTTIAIIGLGYVALPLALRFAEAGVRVIGLDVDPKKVDALNEGRSYIKHIPSVGKRMYPLKKIEFLRLTPCPPI